MIDVFALNNVKYVLAGIDRSIFSNTFVVLKIVVENSDGHGCIKDAIYVWRDLKQLKIMIKICLTMMPELISRKRSLDILKRLHSGKSSYM